MALGSLGVLAARSKASGIVEFTVGPVPTGRFDGHLIGR